MPSPPGTVPSVPAIGRVRPGPGRAGRGHRAGPVHRRPAPPGDAERRPAASGAMPTAAGAAAAHEAGALAARARVDPVDRRVGGAAAARRRRGPQLRGLPREEVLQRPAPQPRRRPVRHAGARPDRPVHRPAGGRRRRRDGRRGRGRVRADRGRLRGAGPPSPTRPRPWRRARRCCTRTRRRGGHSPTPGRQRLRRDPPARPATRGGVRGGRRGLPATFPPSGCSTSRWRRTPPSAGWTGPAQRGTAGAADVRPRCPFLTRDEICRVFGLAKDQVRVVAKRVGGGLRRQAGDADRGHRRAGRAAHRAAGAAGADPRGGVHRGDHPAPDGGSRSRWARPATAR